MLAERRTCDAQNFCHMNLTVAGFLERVDYESALDEGNHLEFRLAPGQLKQLLRWDYNSPTRTFDGSSAGSKKRDIMVTVSADRTDL